MNDNQVGQLKRNWERIFEMNAIDRTIVSTFIEMTSWGMGEGFLDENKKNKINV